MTKRDNPGVLVRAMYEEPLNTMRGWFSGPQAGESHVGLLEDKEMDPSMELPIDETNRSAPRSRSPFAGWRPKDARRLFWVMMPSYIARAFGHGTDDSTIPAANATSYLNGLRGVASLIVALQHTIDGDYPLVHRAWGETEDNRYLIQLPFIRILHSGVFMVSVFFIISGFALTYGPLKKSYNGQSAAAISSLPSSVFRRPFRLFLPAVPVLIVSTALVPFQAFYALNSTEPMGPVAVGFWGHVHYVWSSLVLIVTTGTNNTVMPQAWTLAAEYEGSLLVFLCCMAFARASPLVRMPSVFMLLVFLFNLGRSTSCLFLVGMLLADFRHARERLPDLPRAARRAVAAGSWVFLVTALFLGGWPMHGDAYAAPGYSWLIGVPTFGFSTTVFFQGTSAVALVVVLENLPVLQRLLNARWVLYLGEISYGLYLVHWVCGKCFLTYGLKLRLLREGHSLAVAWSALFAITMVLCMWLGDLHWRLVDQKSVRFSHWLGKKFGI